MFKHILKCFVVCFLKTVTKYRQEYLFDYAICNVLSSYDIEAYKNVMLLDAVN